MDNLNQSDSYGSCFSQRLTMSKYAIVQLFTIINCRLLCMQYGDICFIDMNEKTLDAYVYLSIWIKTTATAMYK